MEMTPAEFLPIFFLHICLHNKLVFGMGGGVESNLGFSGISLLPAGI